MLTQKNETEDEYSRFILVDDSAFISDQYGRDEVEISAAIGCDRVWVSFVSMDDDHDLSRESVQGIVNLLQRWLDA